MKGIVPGLAAEKYKYTGKGNVSMKYIGDRVTEYHGAEPQSLSHYLKNKTLLRKIALDELDQHKMVIRLSILRQK